MIYVLHHGGGCPDGFGAAWAAHHKLADEGVQYIPVLYHERVPAMEPGSTVYLVDFCYARETLIHLAGRHARVVILDHHKSSAEALIGEKGIGEYIGTAGIDGLEVHFDMKHSGAVLTWQHFHPGEPVPLLLQYVEDRDLWRWKLAYSPEISAYLASLPQTFEMWTDVADNLERSATWRSPFTEGEGYRHRGHMLEGGAAILRVQAKTVEAAVERSRLAFIAGHWIPIVNATVHGSETAEALCLAHPEAPFAAYYFDTKDGRRGWGLRSRGGFDVAEVAKRFGGGGHAAAAGFVTGLDFYGEENNE